MPKLIESIEKRVGVVLPAEVLIRYNNAPSLPQNFVNRPELLEALRNTLFTEGENRNTAITAMQGMGCLGNKITVLGMAEHSGRVHFQVTPNKSAEAIKPVLDKMLSHNVSQVVTDSHPAYSFLIPKHLHIETSHKDELREMGFVSMRTIEGTLSLFKRGLIGSYHKLSQDHLDSYLGEFCWR